MWDKQPSPAWREAQETSANFLLRLRGRIDGPSRRMPVVWENSRLGTGKTLLPDVSGNSTDGDDPLLRGPARGKEWASSSAHRSSIQSFAGRTAYGVQETPSPLLLIVS